MSGSDIDAEGWRSLDGIPLKDGEPAFDEPWQAQAFAMAVALNERGLFSWEEWAQTLGAQIADDPMRPYWGHWLAAIETIAERSNLLTKSAIAERERLWHEAAARTPHGKPIEL